MTGRTEMPETKDEAPAVAAPEVAAPPAPPPAAPAPEPDNFLVKLAKGAESILVNPTCVAAHVAIGWHIAK